MSISSIDEMLMGGSSNQSPMPTEEKRMQDEQEHIEEIEYNEEPEHPEEIEEQEQSEEPEELEEPEEEKEPDVDEYGNEKEPENEVIRERLARQARKHQAEIESLRAQLAQQGASQQVQQAAKDFEYDPDASGDWQQQLAAFVKQTVNSMSEEKVQQQKQREEAEAHLAFETKFKQGMSQFDDFTDVITSLPFDISNPMTLATRGMDNPAAFLYAAAKRNPQELERISKIRDPYAQMTEMGKLEERMRRNKTTTKAPRPLGRTKDDATTKVKAKERDLTGDDLLAKADARRISTRKGIAKGRR